MENIDVLISLVEKRPLMFIESKRIDYLYYLLIGYLAGKGDQKTDIDRYFHSRFFHWSLQWVRNNINTNYDLHGIYWYYIYKDNTKNEEEALNLFFRVCKIFFLEYYSNH